jgi:hypothetical protein
LVPASRFLKFPILNRKKKFRTWTLGPIWRARICKWPGGFMKGGRTERAGRAAGRAAARCGVSSGSQPPPPLAGAREPIPGRLRHPLPTHPRPRTENLQAPRGPWDLPGAPRVSARPLGEAWEVVRSSWAWFLAASRFLKFPILNRDKKFRTWTLGPMWRARACIWPGGSMKGAERSTKGQWADGAWGGCPGNPWAPLQAQRELLTYPSNSYRAALEQLPTVCRRFCR